MQLVQLWSVTFENNLEKILSSIRSKQKLRVKCKFKYASENKTGTEETHLVWMTKSSVIRNNKRYQSKTSVLGRQLGKYKTRTWKHLNEFFHHALVLPFQTSKMFVLFWSMLITVYPDFPFFMIIARLVRCLCKYFWFSRRSAIKKFA